VSLPPQAYKKGIYRCRRIREGFMGDSLANRSGSVHRASAGGRYTCTSGKNFAQNHTADYWKGDGETGYGIGIEII
jgi:hypothetical protein